MLKREKQILLIYLLLTVTTLLAFWQVSHCDFISYDDSIYVTENVHIRNGITSGSDSVGLHDRLCCKLASPDMDVPHAGCSTLWIKSAMASSDQSFIPSLQIHCCSFSFFTE